LQNETHGKEALMTKRNKQLQALKKAAKRRSRRPVPTHAPAAALKANHGLERRMSRDHLDVLQNIEFALVTANRDTDDMDDQVVRAVLVAAIRGSEPADARVKWALDFLQSIREQRSNVSDELWSDGLRVVLTSVLRHSECRAGDMAYLNFASRFIH
jgi:hypothetical protein